MKKVAVILWTVASACVSTVRADLGQTRLQIEAKYGKQVGNSIPDIDGSVHWPASIQDRNSKVYKRPPQYAVVYRSGKSKIMVHYNDKGIVTMVIYECSDARVDAFSETDLPSFLEQSGFASVAAFKPVSFVDQYYRSHLPDTPFAIDNVTYLSIRWSDSDADAMIQRLTGQTAEKAKITEIELITGEALGDLQKSGDRWKQFGDVVKQITGLRPGP